MGAAAGAAGQNPFGSGMFGGAGAGAVPADTRPPEERFQVQLQVRFPMRSKPCLVPFFFICLFL